MSKNKKFNLLNITKGSLSVAAMFFPVIFSSNSVSSIPTKNPGVKITTSANFNQYIRKYTDVTNPAEGYVSLVSGRASKGSANTPIGPGPARQNMLTQIFQETGQAIITPSSSGNVQFKSQPPSNGQNPSPTITVRTSLGKVIKVSNQTSGPKLGNFPIVP